jgi:hypothetical protein
MQLKSYLYGAWAVLVSCTPLMAQANLALDKSVTPKQLVERLWPHNKPINQIAIIKAVAPYANAHTADWHDGYKTPFYVDRPEDSADPVFFAWLFNGHQYISAVVSINSDPVPLADYKHEDENPLTDMSSWINTRQQTCHLFMLNPDLSVNAVFPINIVRVKGRLVGKPRCSYVKAMAVAKAVPDAMLITLGYSDSAAPADKNESPREFITTVLLRFSEQKGKLNIQQDDRCLENPSPFKTIAAARKALSSPECRWVEKR